MGKIVGLDGQPFSFDPEPQTEALDIPQIANRLIEHPASGITQNRAAQCLRAAESGDLTAQADLAADIEEKNAHLFAEMAKRRLAVQSTPWGIDPPLNASAREKKDAERLDEYLRGASWFDAMLFDATDAILKGYSCQEIQWGRRGREFVINRVCWRDAAHFCLNPDNLSDLRLRDGSYQGAPFQPFGWIVHQARSRTGYAGTRGLVRTLIWPFIFTGYSIRDLAEFLEVYGLPMKIGKYPSGASREQKAALLRAVMDIGRRTGGIIPTGMSLDFEEAASGHSDPFLAMIQWGERAISKAILGGTLTTEAGDKGARSLGEVHNEVRHEIRDSDIKQLFATLTRDLVYPLYALNTPNQVDISRLPRLVSRANNVGDIRRITATITQLAQGMPVPLSWVRDQTGVPEPVADEPLFAPAGTRMDEAALAAQLPASVSADARDKPGDLGDSVPARTLQGVIDPLLEPIIGMTAPPDLPSLYQQMDDKKLMALLGDAMFAAEIKGMVDDIER